MAKKTLDYELQQYWPLLANEEKKAIIMIIKSLAKRSYIERYNTEIDDAMERVEKGEFYTQQEVKKMSESW